MYLCEICEKEPTSQFEDFEYRDKKNVTTEIHIVCEPCKYEAHFFLGNNKVKICDVELFIGYGDSDEVKEAKRKIHELAVKVRREQLK